MAREVIDLARRLLAKGGALQSVQGVDQIDASKLRAELEDALKKNVAGATALEASSAAAAILANADRALNRSDTNNLSDDEYSSLEAIIHITGRPAMRYSSGQVDMPPNELAENSTWSVFVAISRDKINEASAGVGRVSEDGGILHYGTAWMLRDDLVVTNRHVARAIASDPNAAPLGWTLDADRTIIVDFAATNGTPAPQSFPIAAIAYCDGDPHIDLAILRIAAQGKRLPKPSKVNWNPEAVVGEQIYVVGHPWSVPTSAVETVFGHADGFKRCSPGFVTRWAKNPRAFEHDCSTLPGNSGSCVLTTSLHEVIGLHYGSLGPKNPSEARANIALALSKLDHGAARQLLRAEEN